MNDQDKTRHDENSPARALREAKDVLLTRASVAHRLGLSVARIGQLDDELCPLRTESGVRLYLKSEIEAYAARRDFRKDSL